LNFLHGVKDDVRPQAMTWNTVCTVLYVLSTIKRVQLAEQ
jgi:hypothetical protein